MISKQIDRMVEEVRIGRMSRREFMGRTGALGLTAAAGTSLLSKAGMAQEPKRGGTITVATEYSGPEETFDPGKMSNPTDIQRSYQVYDRLLDLNRDMEPIPNLAVEWEGMPGATEWTFKLRKGVEFHNGKTLTADDVIYSIGEHIKEGSESSGKPLLEDIVELKADGPDIVKFTLANGNADFPITFGYAYQTSIVAEGWKDGDPVNGTGLYRLVEFNPGRESVTERYANYWDESVGFADRFVTYGIADNTARLNALRSGAVDVVNDLEPRLAEMVNDDPNIRVESTPSGAHFVFVMMCDRSPTDDLNVRLALKHALDRNVIVDTLLLGQGLVGNDFPVNPALPTYCREIPQHAYDPEKASFYWEKTGLSSIELIVSDAAHPNAVDSGVILQEHARKAGIEITLNRVPSDGYWKNVWRQVPFHQSAWQSRPTADLILTAVYKSDAPWNETRWQNDRFDNLLFEGRVELNPAKRYEIYCEAETLLHDEGGAFIPFFKNYLAGAHNRLQNFTGSAANELGAGWLYREAWIEEKT